jgi:hypothetical protein
VVERKSARNSRMKTASLLLVAVIMCGAVGLSRAQTPSDSGDAIKRQANPEPTIPQAYRDISKIPAESPGAAPTVPISERRIVTHIQEPVIHAGGRNFSPPAMKCAQAIQDALNSETLVPAPDEKCADMMEDALDARLRTGQ